MFKRAVCFLLCAVIFLTFTVCKDSNEELSERQKRQQGAFIIFPNLIKEHPQEKEKYLMFCEINELGKEHSFVKERIIIPKEKKKEFIRILKNYGITEEFLFSDSTDIICKTIREESKYRLAKKVGEKSD